jgi:hypothetical protein
MGKQFVTNLLSKEKDQNARTPRSIHTLVRNLFLGSSKVPIHDPAPANRPPSYDGLTSPWGALNYVNPPFKSIEPWVTKAISEQALGRSSVFLIPARTHTAYFSKLVFKSASQIILLQNKVVFEGYDRPIPDAMMLVVFGDTPILNLALARLNGHPVRIRTLFTTMMNVTRHNALLNDVIPDLAEMYGPLKFVDLESTTPSPEKWVAPAVILVRANSRQYVKAVSKLIAPKKGAPATGPFILILPLCYSSNYFCRTVAPLCNHIIFVQPALSMPGHERPSSTGSMIAVFGTKDRPAGMLFRSINLLQAGSCMAQLD